MGTHNVLTIIIIKKTISYKVQKYGYKIKYKIFYYHQDTRVRSRHIVALVFFLHISTQPLVGIVTLSYQFHTLPSK